MEVSSGSGGRRPLAQINVTPLVDVMLVLLIIFMVTAPMMEKGLDVNLPQVAKAADLSAQKEPLVVTVQQGGAIALGDERMRSLDALAVALKQMLRTTPEREVFLKADKDVAYGRVMEVMAAVRNAGVTKLGMVAEQR